MQADRATLLSSIPASLPVHELRAIFTVPRVAGKYPLVVMAHGHGGTKDENGGFTAIAERLAVRGIATIRMDFPGSGASTEPFIQNNLTNMIADAAARAYAIASAPIDTKAIGIFGYSMGGGVAILSASAPLWRPCLGRRGKSSPCLRKAFTVASADPWVDLTHIRAVQVVHNPRYAGAFAYGRHRTRRTGTSRLLPPDQLILLQDVHPGYISWDQYQANQRQLRENAQALGQDRKSALREGPALLQGLVLCGVCGKRMTVRYHDRDGCRVP